jgi:hypothetical protein
MYIPVCVLCCSLQIAEGEGEHLGDVSTLADPSVVEVLIAKVSAVMALRANGSN